MNELGEYWDDDYFKPSRADRLWLVVYKRLRTSKFFRLADYSYTANPADPTQIDTLELRLLRKSWQITAIFGPATTFGIWFGRRQIFCSEVSNSRLYKPLNWLFLNLFAAQSLYNDEQRAAYYYDDFTITGYR